MKNVVLFLSLYFLLFVLNGCTQTEEGKASFGVLFLLLFAIGAAVLSFILNLFALGGILLLRKFKKENSMKGIPKKFFSFFGVAFAVLSILVSILLLIATFANFFRCSGGCMRIIGATVPVLLISLIPAIFGFLQFKLRKKLG